MTLHLDNDPWPWPNLWPFAADIRPEVTTSEDGHWYIAVPAAGPTAFIAPNRLGDLALRGVEGTYHPAVAREMVAQLATVIAEAAHRTGFTGDLRERHLEAWRRKFLDDTAIDAQTTRARLTHGWGMATWPLDRLVEFSRRHGVEPVDAPVTAVGEVA